MIINGGSRSNWRFFAKHLMKTEENEQVRIADIRGLAADTLLEAFREMDALASGTRCKNFFYHANLNPRADELLTEGQWDQAVDVLEEHLGLIGHSRFIVEHEKEGRRHRHVVWSRIDTDTMTAVSDSNNFAAHERVARSLEEAFGHAPVGGAHGRDGKRPRRRPKNWETFRGHESGIAPEVVTREVTALWHQADSGRAFMASLSEHGYRLCRGDQRGYCLLDAAGDVHSLARRIEGVRTVDIRARLSDLSLDTLPGVAAVREALAAESKLADPQGRAAVQTGAREVTALDAFARDVSQTLRANGGEPHLLDGLSWWERSVTVLTSARDQVAGWVKGQWQELVDLVRREHRWSDDREIER